MKSAQGHAKYTLREQAYKYIAARANRGKSKASGAILRSDRTVQRYQGDLARAAEWIQQQYGITKLKDITQEQAQAYIQQRLQENVRVRTLYGYAKALELLPLVVQPIPLPKRTSDPKDKPRQSRAYTSAQVAWVCRKLTFPATQLACKILLESGCRSQDLASMRLESERPIRNARLASLLPERFLGRETWVKVSFVGKGGHEYVSTIHPETARALAKYRLETPKDFRERGQENIVTRQWYDLPSGQKLSRIWSTTCQQSLGYSKGIHGLRHTFAQERVRVLQTLGMPWQKALECVSQQMGHYRASQVKVYLI